MTKKELEELYIRSCPTMEGVSTDGLDEALKNIDPNVEWTMCSGKDMNEAYKLTGSNAYPDDLHILIITKWSIPMMNWKLLYNFRWLDDVIDNNKRREKENH